MTIMMTLLVKPEMILVIILEMIPEPIEEDSRMDLMKPLMPLPATLPPWIALLKHTLTSINATDLILGSNLVVKPALVLILLGAQLMPVVMMRLTHVTTKKSVMSLKLLKLLLIAA